VHLALSLPCLCQNFHSWWKFDKNLTEIILHDICTAQCTLVFVTLVDCDHIGWKSRKLIARPIITNTFTLCSQKAIHLVPGEHGEILGRLKVAKWVGKKWHAGEQKTAISLKRVKIEEKLLWTAY